MPDYLRIVIGLILVALVVGAIVIYGQVHGSRDRSGATSTSKQTTTDGVRVQAPLGGIPEDWGHLPLHITAIFQNQRPLDAKPWHADGGDWTFFDCAIPDNKSGAITVGIQAGRADSGDPSLCWGHALLAVSGREAAVGFIEAMGSAFHREPPASRQGHPPGCIKMQTAGLGTDVARSPEGGFGGGKGNWTATKWFLQADGYEAEVFFNFSLKDRQAEFSEKDEEYREDLIAQLAQALRDGPLPERTPENDLTLGLSGPSFADWHRIGTDEVYLPSLSSDGRRIYFIQSAKGGSSDLCVADTEHPDQVTRIARLEHDIVSYRPLGPDANEFLIEDKVREHEGQISSADVSRLWVVKVGSGAPKGLEGPWVEKDWYLCDLPPSPDGRFITLGAWIGTGKDRNNTLYCLDRQTAKTVTFDLHDQPVVRLEWQAVGDLPRLMIVTGFRWMKKDGAMKAYVGDPTTGKMESSGAAPSAAEIRGLASPDRKRTAILEERSRLVITDEAGRTVTFVFHEDDRRFALEGGVEWASPRYLLFHSMRPAFIDADTLKMSYPLPKGDQMIPVLFARDFSFAIASRDRGLYIGKVILPR